MNFISDIVNRNFLLYIVKFAIFFCILYFGTIAVIGLSVPAGYYSPFIAKHLNYIDWLRTSLLFTSKEFLLLLGYQTYLPDKYDLFMKNGTGIHMVYSCIGYGIMSFWAAFVLANKGSWIKKLKWLIAGWLAIWVINVLRISILVIAVNKNWQMPLGLDHHTWFNIAAYILIFILIYFYDRSSKFLHTRSDNPKHS
jgi:exosortase/archaeosortase family protein